MSLTYRDVAIILALIDGRRHGKIALTQGGMEVRIEKAEARADEAGHSVPAMSTASPAEDE